MKFDSPHFCSFDPNEDPKRRMAIYKHLEKIRKESAARWAEYLLGLRDNPWYSVKDVEKLK